VKAGFDMTNNNKQKPSESEAHVHVTQYRIFVEYFSVKQRLHEYFANSYQTFSRKQVMPDSAFVNFREFGNPDSDDDYQEAGDECQPNGKWPYKRCGSHKQLKI
jgi:hypothetical protein